MDTSSNMDWNDFLVIPSDFIMEKDNSLMKVNSKSFDRAMEYVRTHVPIKVRDKNKLVSPFINNDAREIFLRHMALSITESNGDKG